MSIDAREALADWEDPRVQMVYQMLCADEAPPNHEEHWEGWVARKIVAALAAPAQQVWRACVFEGPPPEGCADWHAWVNSPIKQRVIVRALAAPAQQPVALTEEPVMYQARRKNRFTGEWWPWQTVTADAQEIVNRESVPDEWEFRTLYAHPAAPSDAQPAQQAVAPGLAEARQRFIAFWSDTPDGPSACAAAELTDQLDDLLALSQASGFQALNLTIDSLQHQRDAYKAALAAAPARPLQMVDVASIKPAAPEALAMQDAKAQEWYRMGFEHAKELIAAAAPAHPSHQPPAAQGDDWYEKHKQACEKDHGPYDPDAPLLTRLRWWVPKSSRHGSLYIEDDLLEAARELERSTHPQADQQAAQVVGIVQTRSINGYPMQVEWLASVPAGAYLGLVAPEADRLAAAQQPGGRG